MPWNAGPYRSDSAAPNRPNYTVPLPGSIHKFSPRSLAMHKRRRASPGTSFMSLSESNSPPKGSQLEILDRTDDEQFDDEEVLASPDSPSSRARFLTLEPRMHVEPAQRRSFFLAEGMLKEHLSCSKIGRDKDGLEIYVMRMVESHGFRWNRFLHREGNTDLDWPILQHMDFVDPDSDCSSTDNDENDVFE